MSQSTPFIKPLLAPMENFAYLYVLAEEAAPAAPSTVSVRSKTQQRCSWLRPVVPLSRPTAVVCEKALDRDREHQPYPTFYL